MSEENKVVTEVVAETPKKKVKKERQSNVTIRWAGRGRGLSETAMEALMKCSIKAKTNDNYAPRVDKLQKEYNELRFNVDPDNGPTYSFDKELTIVKKYCKVHMEE